MTDTTTTLTQRILNDIIVEYKYLGGNNLFGIKITTDISHGVIGNVNINLGNCLNIGIETIKEEFIPDYLNTQTFSFKAISTTELSTELTQVSWAQLDVSQEYSTLPNNGSSITATINNPSINIKGKTMLVYLFDTGIQVKDGATIEIQEENITSLSDISYNALKDEFDVQTDNIDGIPFIHGEVFNAQNNLTFSLKNAGALTNIPIRFFID